MKFLILLTLLYSIEYSFSRAPGPSTPGAAPSNTSVMGGGTPGNEGINTLNIDEPTKEELEKMRQDQEEKETSQRDEKNEVKKAKSRFSPQD
jgi:hypothetical protein